MPEEEEYDCESSLFIGAVTTEVEIQNDECYVALPGLRSSQGLGKIKVATITKKEEEQTTPGDSTSLHWIGLVRKTLPH